MARRLRGLLFQYWTANIFFKVFSFNQDWLRVGNDRGNNFGQGRGLINTALLLLLEYIAK